MKIVVLSFDSETSQIAVSVFKELKSKNKLIEIPDLFIAATAMKNNMKLVTLNTKHFERIENLELVDTE